MSGGEEMQVKAFVFSLFMLAASWPYAARADCASPVGVQGELRWISPIMRYCDGTAWQAITYNAARFKAGAPDAADGSTTGISFENNGDTGLFMTNWTSSATGDLAFFSNNIQVMTVRSGGSVGIGTTAPQVRLEVVNPGNTEQQIRASRASNAHATGVSLFPAGTVTAANPGWWYGLRANNAGFSLGTFDGADSTTRMYVSTGGNVGIATATPAYPLDVGGSIRAENVIYTSDARLKTHVQPVSGLDTILRLRGVSYDFKADGRHATGVIAQEIEAVMPHAVLTAPDGIKSVDYIQIIAPLIEAVKELKTDNDDLRTRLVVLEKVKKPEAGNALRLNE